ncbi:FAD-dependent oxidoreductase [Solibacillus sp. MA9]|uniref:FAD-dependent oxidoreductase n=1 Tax=Solibacillus palustris TaxID=2908203 RepID=A0ABS9UEA5_9BACL|nr:FAD-dependent oxidoreductase [Solibacillus sp. MA9]MCH7322649.1 FAD-dependent oxidoreductase [Solibacillus sp. MA9]
MKNKKLLLSIAIIAVIITAIYVIYVITKPKILKQSYETPITLQTFDNEYDVIVIGGEPEGVAAAVMAARSGSKTLLIEKREDLGGLFTFGMLNFLDIPKSKNERNISRGVFEDWHELVGNGNGFDIQDAKAAFKQLVYAEENLTLAVNTTVNNAMMHNNTVTGVEVENQYGAFPIKGKVFIDATQDADFAVMAQAPYFVGGRDIGIEDKKMAVTLMLHLKNIEWRGVKKAAKSEKFGPATVTRSVAWGFSDLHSMYQPVESNTRLRGLNLVKQGEDYYINALQIFDVDGLDEAAKVAAIEKGKRETLHIVDYLRKEFSGFENAEIVSNPTELYVRETRHILAEYQLQMSDIWTNMDHWDNIGYGAYPVDVQAQTPQDYGYVLSTPEQYAIPFRSLVPLEIDGLLVVGRSSGYSSLAAGSARIVPTGMVTGDAAGIAASLAIHEGITVRELSKDEELIEQLRTNLKQQGAFVDHITSTYPYQDEWFDQSIQLLMDYGLVVAGYQNELPIEKEVTMHNFMNMLMSASKRMALENSAAFSDQLQISYDVMYSKENRVLDLQEASDVIAFIFLNESTSKDNWASLIDAEIISEKTAKHIELTKHPLTMKELYAICADVMRYMESHE